LSQVIEISYSMRFLISWIMLSSMVAQRGASLLKIETAMGRPSFQSPMTDLGSHVTNTRTCSSAFTVLKRAVSLQETASALVLSPPLFVFMGRGSKCSTICLGSKFGFGSPRQRIRKFQLAS